MAEMTIREAGRKGGSTTFARHGIEFYQRIGKKGGHERSSHLNYSIFFMKDLKFTPKRLTSYVEVYTIYLLLFWFKERHACNGSVSRKWFRLPMRE